MSYTNNTHTKLTYNQYLKIDELTQLQSLLSDPPHHAELLFIIIHQAYELWFKLILQEIDRVFSFFAHENIRQATSALRRITAIQKLLIDQIHILETMSSKDFFTFRSKLSPASGFQSVQFREIEFASGLKEPHLLEHFKDDAEIYNRLQRRYKAPSLAAAFYDMLQHLGFSMSIANKDIDQNQAQQLQQHNVAELLKIYEQKDKHGDLYDLTETLVDFDELLCLWRMHHVIVVERLIGLKPGTGGSEGVAYLQSTLNKRCFPDLWKLRTQLS